MPQYVCVDLHANTSISTHLYAYIQLLLFRACEAEGSTNCLGLQVSQKVQLQALPEEHTQNQLFTRFANFPGLKNQNRVLGVFTAGIMKGPTRA